MHDRAEAFTLPYAEAFDVSAADGGEFRISVGLPVSYGTTQQSYPVLYVLDADVLFATVLETSRLRGSAGEVGEIVVVGIGYPLGTDVTAWGSRRTYDFSTAEWDLSGPLGREVHGVLAAMGHPLRLGGALPLLSFLTDDLQPMIAERYRIDTADQALFGFSAGGNFVAHVLFRRPEAFARYIAASPAFIYNNWEVFRLEEEYAEKHSDLPVTVVLGAGSDEALHLDNLAIASGTARMAEALHQRRYSSLRLSCELLTGKSHFTTCTEVMQRALETCWPGAPFELSAARAEDNYRDVRA